MLKYILNKNFDLKDCKITTTVFDNFKDCQFEVTFGNFSVANLFVVDSVAVVVVVKE